MSSFFTYPLSVPSKGISVHSMHKVVEMWSVQKAGIIYIVGGSILCIEFITIASIDFIIVLSNQLFEMQYEVSETLAFVIAKHYLV